MRAARPSVPVAAWCRFHSLMRTRRSTRSTVAASNPPTRSRRAPAPGRRGDTGSRRARRTAATSPGPSGSAQFGRGRAVDHAFRDHHPAIRRIAPEGVAPARERVHLGLVQVLDRRIAAAHVAVDRRVADGVFALVAGGEQQAAELVRQRHEDDAAAARLQVLLGHVGRLAFEQRGPALRGSHERFFDRHRFELHAERSHCTAARSFDIPAV